MISDLIDELYWEEIPILLNKVYQGRRLASWDQLNLESEISYALEFSFEYGPQIEDISEQWAREIVEAQIMNNLRRIKKEFIYRLNLIHENKSNQKIVERLESVNNLQVIHNAFVIDQMI